MSVKKGKKHEMKYDVGPERVQHVLAKLLKHAK